VKWSGRLDSNQRPPAPKAKSDPDRLVHDDVLFSLFSQQHVGCGRLLTVRSSGYVTVRHKGRRRHQHRVPQLLQLDDGLQRTCVRLPRNVGQLENLAQLASVIEVRPSIT
jgi:hypothetical protein